MSQPVALIAAIPIDAKSFQKILRAPECIPLQQQIVDELQYRAGNYYVLRYIKAEALAFAYFHFRYGHADSLATSPLLTFLHALADQADAQRTGFILAHLDALNLVPTDTLMAWQVHAGQSTPIPELDAAANKELQRLTRKYFYHVERDFAEGFARFADRPLVRRCLALLEERRIASLSTHLPTSSPLHPLYLFQNYFYNGEYLYAVDGRVHQLPDVNVRQFVPSSYGGNDGQHVVVGAQQLPDADPTSFKDMKKGELLFYKDARHVWNDCLQPLAEADAPSFRLASHFHAEDARALYFAGLRIAKDTLGSFHFPAIGYYYCDKLLIGTHAIYLGRWQLDLDAASFKIKRYFATGMHIAYEVSDHTGSYLLHADLDAPHAQPALLTPCSDAEARLAERLAAREHQRPTVDHAHATLEDERRWAADLPMLAERHSRDLDMQFFVHINNYFYRLFHAGEYAELLATYTQIASSAWCNPHIFHHTACALTALGRLDEALAEVRKAQVYGYEHMDLIWQDEDLAALRQHPQFLALQANDTGSPVMSLDLLEALTHSAAAEVDARALQQLVLGLALRLRLPSCAEVLAQTEHTITAQHPLLERYQLLLSHLFQQTLRLDTFGYAEERFYHVYAPHPDLHAIAHLNAAEDFFRSAHGFNGGIDPRTMEKVSAAVSQAAGALQRHPEWYKDPQWQAHLAAHPFHADLLAWQSSGRLC